MKTIDDLILDTIWLAACKCRAGFTGLAEWRRCGQISPIQYDGPIRTGRFIKPRRHNR